MEDFLDILYRLSQKYKIQVVLSEQKEYICLINDKPTGKGEYLGISDNFLLALLSGIYNFITAPKRYDRFSDEERDKVREIYSQFVARRYVRREEDGTII